jgi:hypothetical protein
MNHPITWGEYLLFRFLLAAVLMVVLLIAAVVVMVRTWWDDVHVNDEPKNDDGPGAGKTLGL